MGLPYHPTCLLRNLYSGQEGTVRPRHGTMDWFQIGKGVCQGCILSPYLFNLYAEYIMWNARLDKAQAGIKISRRNINNLSRTLLLLLLSSFNHVQLCDPIDSSPPGSSVPGILQARTLEWVAISFSNAWKWKVKVKSLSRVRLFETPWSAACQAPPSMGFSRQEYWSRVPLSSPNSPLRANN